MLSLYNTLSHKKEKFKPVRKTVVTLYTCGPTVYDFAHLGNWRTFIFEDVLRRALTYCGYRVRQVMNITDIEDKIIKRLQREGKKRLRAVTAPYSRAFFEDLKKLNLEPAEFYPTVTGHLPEIIALIKKLEARGFAYRGKDGSVYFDISQFNHYGRLAGLAKMNLKRSGRLLADEYGKEEARDFVLWKAKRPGEPSWPSPFGRGRPGWHIECAALALKYLGQPIDLHVGGVDLIFPHHENEMAEAEAATGRQFVRYWLHGEHLLVNRRKMAKSLGNFYTLRDLEKRGFSPLSFRYFVLGAHYRSKLNFTWQNLRAAQNSLYHLYRQTAYFDWLNSRPRAEKSESRLLNQYRRQFLGFISDDLNTPKALALLWQLSADQKLSPAAKKSLLLEFDAVLGLGLRGVRNLIKTPPAVKRLVKEREKVRNNKQFVQADGLRKRIEALGYIIEDTPEGPFVWPKKI